MADGNPLYTSPDRAAAGPYGGIVAPPAMLQVWTMVGLHLGGPPERVVEDAPSAGVHQLPDDPAFVGLGPTTATSPYDPLPPPAPLPRGEAREGRRGRGQAHGGEREEARHHHQAGGGDLADHGREAQPDHRQREPSLPVELHRTARYTRIRHTWRAMADGSGVDSFFEKGFYL